MTSELVTGLLNAVEQAAPNSAAVEIATAAVSTAASGINPVSILADLELAISLVKEFKSKLAGLHPSVINIVKLLF